MKLPALAFLLASTPLAAAPPAVDPARLAETVKILASDAFEGRGPGTPGETKTIDYLVGRFKALGLQPAGDKGGWTQAVPLVRTQLGTPETLAAGGKALAMGKDIYATTVRPIDRVAIAAAPMVFVGYGVSAPEKQWDDFKGVDLKGKVAVFLINDPDYDAAADEPVAGRFSGKAMTYYGRWTYKYEEAARRGAIAALIVHDMGAGYGWSTVVAGGGGNYDLLRGAGERQGLPLQGWLSGEAAGALFQAAGLDLAALRVAARRADFQPVELKGQSFDAAIPVSHEVVQSHNVLAKLPGTTHADEAIVYAAHWDAYGLGTPDAENKRVRPGANDDALGVAAVLEAARLFVAGPKPARSIVFAAWTAEERGLLGSEAYARKPLVPLEKTVANFTYDIFQTAGRAHDVVQIGGGQSDLDDALVAAARAQGRTVTPDARPERGLFYRADHFSLAKRGVPVLLMMGIGGGADLVNGGRAAGDAWVKDYTDRCYHKSCDAYGADWNLEGAAEDTALFVTIGRDLANSRRWPAWRAGTEFKALRDKSAAARK
ncbi:M20/M25/M40 family metallo-hydrolase [Sphingomonas naphthae]|uniref:M20/M25/M40 family metallo-hydrolase n=1 Tax=Sphingomonas naphthae TaxID=1813468 RepID=A0ABY7TLC6_9SPHN|nr:M28 family peptidase [Sphingomonas naphthae]WCT74043.1 M20/M25/M40 family metallo-hydrolase [Sphingomonas naphthae]